MGKGLQCWSNCVIPSHRSRPLTPIVPPPTASVGTEVEEPRRPIPSAPRLRGAAEGGPAGEVQPHRHPQGLPLPVAGPQRLPKFQQDPGAIWRTPLGGHFSQARHPLHPGAPQWLGTPPPQTQLQQSGPGLGP
uniref:Myozenin 3 n=1 Tax=Aotus nancymaae TaxID=37293 RepID=A0A2K5F519_AOTNA